MAFIVRKSPIEMEVHAISLQNTAGLVMQATKNNRSDRRNIRQKSHMTEYHNVGGCDDGPLRGLMPGVITAFNIAHRIQFTGVLATPRVFPRRTHNKKGAWPFFAVVDRWVGCVGPAAVYFWHEYFFTYSTTSGKAALSFGVVRDWLKKPSQVTLAFRAYCEIRTATPSLDQNEIGRVKWRVRAWVVCLMENH